MGKTRSFTIPLVMPGISALPRTKSAGRLLARQPSNDGERDRGRGESYYHFVVVFQYYNTTTEYDVACEEQSTVPTKQCIFRCP